MDVLLEEEKLNNRPILVILTNKLCGNTRRNFKIIVIRKRYSTVSCFEFFDVIPRYGKVYENLTIFLIFYI